MAMPLAAHPDPEFNSRPSQPSTTESDALFCHSGIHTYRIVISINKSLRGTKRCGERAERRLGSYQHWLLLKYTW